MVSRAFVVVIFVVVVVVVFGVVVVIDVVYINVEGRKRKKKRSERKRVKQAAPSSLEYRFPLVVTMGSSILLSLFFPLFLLLLFLLPSLPL